MKNRREWLQRLPVPALAASFAAPLAEAQAAPVQNELGARVYNVRSYGAKGDGATLDAESRFTSASAHPIAPEQTVICLRHYSQHFLQQYPRQSHHQSVAAS